MTNAVSPALDLEAALRCFWHPVCTLDELGAAKPGGRGPLAIQLLGERLVIADLPGSGLTALRDRCTHRSTRLSIATVEDAGLRCAYHGWCFSADGRCTDIPALPGVPIPRRADVESFAVTTAYDLVWVNLTSAVADLVPLPASPAHADAEMRVVPGRPYTWPVGAARRVENFVDLSHFAWVHAGTLGRRDEPVPPLPEIVRDDHELRFTYDPPELAAAETALYGYSWYRMPIPLTVSIEFELESGARRALWMTASPRTMAETRSFWFVSRSDDLDGDDGPHLAFQDLVLAEDEPVVCNQDPPELVLDPGAELSVKTDKVSIEYRRWLREMAMAAADGPLAVLRAAGVRAPAAMYLDAAATPGR